MTGYRKRFGSVLLIKKHHAKENCINLHVQIIPIISMYQGVIFFLWHEIEMETGFVYTLVVFVSASTA